jgi:hypothetical protein
MGYWRLCCDAFVTIPATPITIHATKRTMPTAGITNSIASATTSKTMRVM